MSRLKSKRGESLIETLASVLVISMGVLILTGAIVTSAKVNDSAQREAAVSFANEMDPEENSHESGTVTVSSGSMTQNYNVTIYTQKQEGGSGDAAVLYYYR